MAALRSAMAMLGRRSCGSSGSSVATSMGGRGMEIHQVLRPAPPQHRPAAAVRRNLESWRRFSTESSAPKDKTDNFPLRVWQWAKYRVENASLVTKTRVVGVYLLVAIGTPTLYMVNTVRNWRPNP